MIKFSFIILANIIIATFSTEPNASDSFAASCKFAVYAEKAYTNNYFITLTNNQDFTSSAADDNNSGEISIPIVIVPAASPDNGGSVYVQDSGADVIYTVQKEFSKFHSVDIGNDTLSQGTHYTVKSGDSSVQGDLTIVHILPEYLDSLLPDIYTLTVHFNDNTAASVQFAIEEKAPMPASVEMPINPFEDVFGTDWYVDNVVFVYDNGLMNGTSIEPMLFSPRLPLTRAMIMTILYRQAREPDIDGIENPFADVPDNQWFTDAIIWAADNAIVTGYGEGRFGPSDSVTRQDLAVILLRYMTYLDVNPLVTLELIVFADESEISGYAAGSIQTFFKLGIINGSGTNEEDRTIINPKGFATRAQVAAMLHRFVDTIL